MRIFVGLVIVALVLAPVVPSQVAYADDTSDPGTEETETTEDDTSTSTDDGTDGDDGNDSGDDGENGTTTDDGTGTTTGDGTDGTDGGDGTEGEQGTTTDDTTGTTTDAGTGTSTGDGTDGEDGSDENDTDGENGTTTDDGTGTTTDDGTGSNGGTGPDGTDGDDGAASTTESASPEDEGEPVPVFSEHDIGDETTPEDGEGITGDVSENGGRNVTIETGPAKAQGELFSDVNSNDVKSEADQEDFNDLDHYTFNATGTNEATVQNTGGAFALTGDNAVEDSRGIAEIKTGNSVSAFNVANVVNSSVVNSDGFLFLKNQVLGDSESLDLRDLFFPDPDGTLAGAEDCTLLSCVAEDIVYNYTQTNHATERCEH